MEILYLYDEPVEVSEIKFVPDAQCDAIYYIDRFDKKKFIKIECLFSRAQEEKIAELEHIAYSLGAKSCSIEISEMSKELKESKKKVGFTEGIKTKFGTIKSEENVEQDIFSKNNYQSSGRGTIHFQGHDNPTHPELKWFQHDENINRMIEMRCEGRNAIKSKTFELEGASTAVMSMKTACAIDSAVGKMAQMKGTSTMETQANKEHRSRFIFSLEF